jgi:hypothetical protein
MDPISGSCKWKSSGGTRVTVDEGEVTRIRQTTVEICINGSIKLKKKADVGPNFPLACNGEIIENYSELQFK